MKFNKDFPKQIKVGAIAPPTRLYPDNLIGGNRKMRMLEEHFLSLLMDVLGFESEIVEPADKEYGHVQKDGNWTGLIGMVQREEVDFALARIAMSYQRTTAVNFSYPYSYTPVTFVTDKPSRSSTTTALIKPFPFVVWVTILTFLLIVILILYASKTRIRNSDPILLTYGVLLEKSIKFNFKKRSLRWLILFWIIGAMFISLSYKAVLLSFFTVPVFSGVRDIAELSAASEKSSFKCSTFRGSKEYYELNAAEDEALKKISQCLNRSNSLTNDVEAFLLPTNYKKAFITIRTFISSFQKNYFLSEDVFFVNMGGIAIRKTFCCKETINEIIHKITASGILHKFLLEDEFFMSLAEKDLGKEDSDLKKLSLRDISLVFMVLLFGLFLGCIVFVLEVILGRK